MISGGAHVGLGHEPHGSRHRTLERRAYQVLLSGWGMQCLRLVKPGQPPTQPGSMGERSRDSDCVERRPWLCAHGVVRDRAHMLRWADTLARTQRVRRTRRTASRPSGHGTYHGTNAQRHHAQLLRCSHASSHAKSHAHTMAHTRNVLRLTSHHSPGRRRRHYRGRSQAGHNVQPRGQK